MSLVTQERQVITELCEVLGMDATTVFANLKIDITDVKPALDPLTGLSLAE